MAGREQLVNDATTTLNGAINDSVTSVTVTTGSVFPSEGNFRVIVNSEIMLVTARATDVLTVVRGQDGTPAASHSDTDTIKFVVSSESLTTLMDQACGATTGMMGGYSNKYPFRILNKAGATLTTSDFAWINQGTSVITDDPSGVITMTVTETSGGTKLQTITMPSAPFVLTANILFGAGHNFSNPSTTIGIGARDSSSSRFQIVNAEIGDQCAFERWTNPTTFSANSATSTPTRIREDSMWLRYEDNNTNIIASISVDGFTWLQIGQDTRTAWLASADQLVWAVNTRGAASNFATLRAWVEHS